MDEQTALVLALQLMALVSIAGALLVYLMCKIRAETDVETADSSPGSGKPILVTSCDNAAGLQIAIYLANRGFRVFAGLKDGAASGETGDSVSSRVIRAWQKERESTPRPLQGTLVALPLDVNREDLLHESVDIIRAHLPAGKDGLWAVMYTSGLLYKGRLEQQHVSHWEAIMKTNVLGLLRVARTYQGLLRNTSGRIITFGTSEGGEEAGLVAYTASRYAVKGAGNALRQELAPLGIGVVNLNPAGISNEYMLTPPKIVNKTNEVSVDLSECLEYQPVVLCQKSLQVIDEVLSCPKPKRSYNLMQKRLWQIRPSDIFNVA